MAVTLDAVTVNNATFANSFSHAAGGSVRGALLLISGPDAATTAASYGGVAMTQIPGSPATSVGEFVGALPPAQVFFLGSGVPTGTQTVTLTGPSANGVLAEIRTFNAATDMEVIDVLAISNPSIANPTGTLALGGREAAVSSVWQSGHNLASGVTPPTGWTDTFKQQLTNACVGHYALTAIGTADVTNAGVVQSTEDIVFLGVAVGEVVVAASDPAITDFGDELHLDGETGVVITGSDFEAVQGTGTVIISPTDNISDGAAVAQTVTAWSDTSITVTINRGALTPGAAMFLFVTNDTGNSNASGYSTQFTFTTRITDTLEDKNGSPVASAAGLVLLVWHSAPTQASPNPTQAIGSLTTDVSGVLDVAVTNPPAFNQDVWIAIIDDDSGGGNWAATARRFTPTYS